MIFALLFLLWTIVLAMAWFASRRTAGVAFAAALALSIALFIHHVTDPLKLSF